MARRGTFLFGLLFISLTLPAQVTNNDTIPECTQDQITQVAAVMEESGFVKSYLTMREQNKQVDTGKDGLAPLLLAVSDLQASWWTDVAPSLPDCSFAAHYQLVGGRMMDELVLGLSFTINAASAFGKSLDAANDLLKQGKYHIDQFTELQSTFDSLGAEIGIQAVSEPVPESTPEG